MRLNIDSVPYTRKPTGAEIGIVVNRLKNASMVQEIDLDGLRRVIAEGRAVTPAELNGTTAENWVSQQLFMIDVDNDSKLLPMLQPGEVVKILADNKIPVVLAFPTFSSKPDKLKFRVGMLCAETVTDPDEARKIIIGIMSLFPTTQETDARGREKTVSQIDLACKNLDRFFYGTSQGLFDEFSGTKTFKKKDALKLYSEPVKEPEQFILSTPPASPSEPEKRTMWQLYDEFPLLDYIIKTTNCKPVRGSGKPYEQRLNPCPFCGGADRFHVNTQDNKYQCFDTMGCGAKGNILTFLMEYEKIERQAAKYNIQDEMGIDWRANQKNYRRKKSEPLTENKKACSLEATQAAVVESAGQSTIPISHDTTKPDPIQENSIMPGDFTDVGECIILAQEYKSHFRYSGATGYITFNGKVWEDIQEKKYAVMQRLTTRQLKEARILEKSAQTKDEKDVAEAYVKFVKSCRNNGKSNGVLTQVQPLILITIDELDANPFLLNTPAGTIDLRTGKMKKHNPADFCTKITKVSPGDKGKDIFLSALDVITKCNPELLIYIQEYMGMVAIGKVFEESLAIAYGGGANGKSTLFNACSRVLGNYAGTIAAETLMVNEKGTKNWDYAELRGKRLIIAAELGEGRRLSDKALKILASTDDIHAEKKHKDPFKFTPSHNVILYTNHLPKVSSSDDGTWRRIIPIPFTTKIEGDTDIKNYADYLVQNAGEYILKWIIEGAKRFIDNGYKIKTPQFILDAKEQYKAANDWITSFLDECCDIEAQHTERSSLILEQYKKHCVLTGDYKRHDGDFKKAMDAQGYKCQKTSIGMVYYGVRLKPHLKDEHGKLSDKKP